MSTIGMFPVNHLPVELQREIFLAAATADPSGARKLVLVAKRVNSWVQPCIYDMVVLGSVDTALFLRTMNSMPPSFFAVHVKKLCLSVSVHPTDAAQILNVCTGVTDLAFWVDQLAIFPDRSVTPLLRSLPLRRLSIEYNHFLSLFWEPEMQLRWYNSLTHLDLIFWRDQTAVEHIPHLERFPHLTHLSLRYRHDSPSETILTAILSTYRNIKVLVILGDTEASDAIEETIWPNDPRVVYIPYPLNVVREWESQARQDPDCLWSRAEELVRTHTAELERTSSGS